MVRQKVYTIRPGDTLSAIARLAGIRLQDLLGLNPQISNPNVIQVGNLIVLPETVDRSKVLLDAARETYPDADPDWFKVAGRELSAGVVERNPSNPRIVEYLATCEGLSQADKSDDGTAWCSALVNWCLGVCGIVGTNSAWALSWADWGEDDPAPGRGSIVVWKRYKGPDERNLRSVGGHVAFLVADQDARLLVRGGNQGDAVSERAYPKQGFLTDSVSGSNKDRHYYKLVGYRKPKGM